MSRAPLRCAVLVLSDKGSRGERIDTSGRVVLSGFRLREGDDLMDLYTAKHFECIWTADELDWAAAVLKKI